MGTKKQRREMTLFLAGALAVVFAPDLFNQTLGKLLKKTIVEVSATGAS